MNGRILARGCLAVALAACLSGCAVVTNRYGLEEPFTGGRVAEIRHGATTRAEILDRFGPPNAVGRTDASMALAAPPSGKPDEWDAAMDNAIRRFAATPGNAGPRILYGYRATDRNWATFVLCGQGGCVDLNSTPVRTTRILFVLIDGTTMRVVDHLLDETQREEPGRDWDPWGP